LLVQGSNTPKERSEGSMTQRLLLQGFKSTKIGGDISLAHALSATFSM
jgi:hypothetical protein